MTCPHCGRNNFNWARRCDHCGQSLTLAGAPVSAGSSTTTQAERPPLDIDGRTFAFNGVSYTALPRSRQLADADVHPLRHQQSGLVIFEMKVFLSEPGTALYDEIKGRPPRSFRTQAEMSVVQGVRMVFEEIYEQDGRLLGLQRAYREHPGPAYCAEQMAAAQSLYQKQQFADAIVAYDAILAGNPSHSVALGNKALALMNRGDVAASLACFERSVGIDFNMAEPQINQAACLAATGQSEKATLILARLLQRYPWSFDNWLALVQMASTQDTVDLAERFIEPGLAALAGTQVGDRVHAAIRESRTRWQGYIAELEQSYAQQVGRRWADALETLARCRTLTPRHAVASMNQAICQYHLSDMTGCRNTLRANHHRLFDRSHVFASLLLWMLSAVSLEDWQGAMAIVSSFQEQIAAGIPVIEMPRVPVAALPGQPRGNGFSLASGASLESPDVAPILAALTGLAGRPECQANAGTIEAVATAYRQVAAL